MAAVAMKPGKPVTIDCMAAVLWLGLPGNPVSACVTWQVPGLPLMAMLDGAEKSAPQRALVVAGQPLQHKPERCEYRPATIIGIDHLGRQIIAAGDAVHSARLSLLADAGGLIVIPASTEAVQQGDLIVFLPFRAG